MIIGPDRYSILKDFNQVRAIPRQGREWELELASEPGLAASTDVIPEVKRRKWKTRRRESDPARGESTSQTGRAGRTKYKFLQNVGLK